MPAFGWFFLGILAGILIAVGIAWLLLWIAGATSHQSYD